MPKVRLLNSYSYSLMWLTNPTGLETGHGLHLGKQAGPLGASLKAGCKHPDFQVWATIWMVWAQPTNMCPQRSERFKCRIQSHCTCCEMKLYDVVTMWTIMQCTGQLWRTDLKEAVFLPGVAAFLSKWLQVLVGGRETRLMQVGILSGVWKWGAFRIVASGRGQQHAYPFLWLPVCATSLPVI